MYSSEYTDATHLVMVQNRQISTCLRKRVAENITLLFYCSIYAVFMTVF